MCTRWGHHPTSSLITTPRHPLAAPCPPCGCGDSWSAWSHRAQPPRSAQTCLHAAPRTRFTAQPPHNEHMLVNFTSPTLLVPLLARHGCAVCPQDTPGLDLRWPRRATSHHRLPDQALPRGCPRGAVLPTTRCPRTRLLPCSPPAFASVLLRPQPSERQRPPVPSVAVLGCVRASPSAGPPHGYNTVPFPLSSTAAPAGNVLF